jgi:signal transduction histidine kinase
MSTRAFGLAALLGALLALSAPARAEGALDVANDLRGIELGHHLALLEDKHGELTLEDVTGPTFASRFQPSTQSAPGFGYSDSAYWVRLVVTNTAAIERAWLLEVAYPLIDYVTLYVPRAEGGYSAREVGDMRPFSQRDLSYRNFVFMLEETPGSQRTYYLRFQSSGSMSLPLVGWTLKEFIEHQHLDWAALCIFYGTLLVIACYNGCLYLFTRQREHLYFALFVLSLANAQFTIVGHTSQFILPNSVALAQLALPVGISLTIYFACLFARYCLPDAELGKTYKRFHEIILPYALALAALSMLAPYRISIRLVTASMVLVNATTFVMHLRMLWTARGAKLVSIAWMALVGGTVVGGLRVAGVLPTNTFTVWAFQIGVAVQVILLSSGLASRLSALRATVKVLNGELSQKVNSLEQALRRAEEATERAERAAKVKDAFMATMSHELRTPLNAIINLPQGLVQDFPVQRYVVCTHCNATFELEPDEVLPQAAACPECAPYGTLAARDVVRYEGRPERTTRYLETIERSGLHLMQVVDGILDAGKMKSGQLRLSFEQVEVGELAREVVEEMSDLAERAGVRVLLSHVPPQIWLSVDRLRLRQVLINLIGNAIKFSDGRGSVFVSAQGDVDGCLFMVRDEGIGIAAENFEKIFDSFGQVHDTNPGKFGGTGLGLSISRSLVRLHSGEMWVESELGRGATFQFRLPRDPAREDTAQAV